MEDPDSISYFGFGFDHWVVYNLPPDVLSLDGETKNAHLVNGGSHGRNSDLYPFYFGPCPPVHSRHRYFFTLYAIDTLLEFPATPYKDEVLEAIDGHILVQDELMGRYMATKER